MLLFSLLAYKVRSETTKITLFSAISTILLCDCVWLSSYAYMYYSRCKLLLLESYNAQPQCNMKRAIRPHFRLCTREVTQPRLSSPHRNSEQTSSKSLQSWAGWLQDPVTQYHHLHGRQSFTLSRFPQPFCCLREKICATTACDYS